MSHATTASPVVQRPGAPTRRPLRFMASGNAKLPPGIWTFSLPAGHSCPFARECQSQANRQTGRITDGRHTTFRCYAATMEARHPSVRKSRWSNLEQLRACRTTADMTRLILDSLSPFCTVLRVHDSGDFFSLTYLSAWVAAARERPKTVFYWYSKSLRAWLAHRDDIGDGYTPGKLSNVVPTASYGGRDDHLISQHRLRSARVVLSVEEAQALGLAIDHTDEHAMQHGPDFALLIHGQQPAGSDAANAARKLRDRGFTGYGRTPHVSLL